MPSLSWHTGTASGSPRPRTEEPWCRGGGGDILSYITTNTTVSSGGAREDLKCDSNSLPAYVVSSVGGGSAEVPHKVDPRHSIIPSAFKWKFHKF